MPDQLHCGTVPEEDLRRLAEDAYQLAAQCCGACRDYHGLWPYRRLTLNPDQAAPDLEVIEPVLARHIGQSGGRVLIAGSADSHLLATVMRAAGERATEIVVADQCATPLELCRRFAARAGRRIETLQTDLLALRLPGPVDVVYANSVLPFFAASQRGDFFASIARALRPGGRFVQVFTTGQPVPAADLDSFCTRYADWVMAQMQTLDITPPAPPAAFRQRLLAFAADGAQRQGALTTAANVKGLAEANGFVIETLDELPVIIRSSHQRYMKNQGKRRLLMVAQRV